MRSPTTHWAMSLSGVQIRTRSTSGSAAARFAAEPEVERVLICTPDKDMAQCVVGDRVVLRDRRRQITYDRDGVLGKWGVEPASIPDWLALVGDSADGFPGLPGWGAKSAAAVLRVYGSIDDIPPKASEWQVPGLTGAVRLAAVLAEQREAAEPVPDARPAPPRHADPPAARRRARVARHAAGDLGGVLRSPGPRAAALAAAPLGGRGQRARQARACYARPVASPRSRAWNAGGAATSPEVRVERAWSYQRDPSNAVTVAPARSATSPAAAMSQAERPVSWTKASNRPFAT